MPYIIVTGWYPTDIVQEVADKYMEVLKKMPFERSFGKETIPVTVSSGKMGIKFMSIMEVKEGKLEDALNWVGDRMRPFMEIKGFEYKTRLWSTVVEALEGIGMSFPG